MVTKAPFATATANDTETLILDINGLEAFREGDKTLFRLSGVKRLDVDWLTMGKILERAGITPRDAEQLVDDFAGKVFHDQLSKVLAERITRVTGA